jgi:hypothetical protein
VDAKALEELGASIWVEAILKNQMFHTEFSVHRFLFIRKPNFRHPAVFSP